MRQQQQQSGISAADIELGRYLHNIIIIYILLSDET